MSNERPIWITGAGGLIGNALVAARADYDRLKIRGLQRQELDLLKFGDVETAFSKERPRAVIHCAALSRGPACRANPDLARRINVDATAHLTALCGEVNVPMVLLSTDLVFDGLKVGGGYVETDSVNPKTVYAETKVEAEAIVLKGSKNIVVRTSLNFGTSPTGDRSFNEDMLRQCRSGRELPLFVDEFRQPILVSVTAEVIWSLLDGNAAGCFHVAGGERLSRWEIGQRLARVHPEMSMWIRPGSVKDYTGEPRSPDTSLDCGRVEALLSIRLPKFTE